VHAAARHLRAPAWHAAGTAPAHPHTCARARAAPVPRAPPLVSRRQPSCSRSIPLVFLVGSFSPETLHEPARRRRPRRPFVSAGTGTQAEVTTRSPPVFGTGAVRVRSVQRFSMHARAAAAGTASQRGSCCCCCRCNCKSLSVPKARGGGVGNRTHYARKKVPAYF
jgi:hypothetical protein